VAIDPKPKGRINQLLIVVTGSVILIGAVLIYFLILRGVYGRIDENTFMPDSKILKDFFLGGKPKIAILYSKYTENMLPEGSTWLNDNITTWKKFLGNLKYEFDIISDQNIESGKLFEYQLLILPGSKSLSDKEVTNIKKFVDRGGSLFATSGIASYSDGGKWRGWEFFSEVFGVRFTKEMRSDEYTKVHTLRGGLPLTANIPTGFPLKVATWDLPIAVEVLDPRTTQTSFWYNYRLEDGLVREGIKKTAGIANGSYGYGRFVWMGFELNSVIGVQEDYVYFDRLFQNCMNWLLYQPIAYTKDWPNGYEAAAILTPNLNEEISNVTNLLEILKAENVKATFFIDPVKIEPHKKLIASLAGYGEFGAIVDIGYLASVKDSVNNLIGLDDQIYKLRNSKSVLESKLNTQVLGVWPYYGLFDQNTISAVIKTGYKYILTDSLTDRSVPKTIIRGDNRIISMTKTARDDYEVIRDFGLTLPDFQFYTYQEDIDRVLFEGGLYIFKLHTEYQCKPENIEVVREVIKDLKKKKFWVTTGSEILKWFEKKDYVELRVERRGRTRISLKVSNPGKQIINNLVVHVDLNDKAENISIDSEIIGTKMPVINFDKNSSKVLLNINNLEAGESRTYLVDYDRVEL
jgi:peptidoglycan/xylan/chitin deacetylase (PgdA/CDA1 family)